LPPPSSRPNHAATSPTTVATWSAAPGDRGGPSQLLYSCSPV
jgi:hypothetical protein